MQKTQGTSRVPGPLGLPPLVGFFKPKASATTVMVSDDPPGAFKHIRRTELIKTANERCADASKINQLHASLCGPAAFLHNVAKHRSGAYFQYVTDLFETGHAQIGTLRVSPGHDCKNYTIRKTSGPPGSDMAEADWVGLAGLRDSENGVFDYDEESDAVAGITMPHELATWFEKAGFAGVQNSTNVYFTKSVGHFLEAERQCRAGRVVAMFVDADCIQSGEQFHPGFIGRTFSTANHWVVLQSMKVKGQFIELGVYTWGINKYRIPQSGSVRLTVDAFVNYYYGFVSAKP